MKMGGAASKKEKGVRVVAQGQHRMRHYMRETLRKGDGRKGRP